MYVCVWISSIHAYTVCMDFQGDITQYQLSVPVQPGNSGGPLFDKAAIIEDFVVLIKVK